MIARDVLVHESKKDDAAGELERWRCKRAWEMVLHGCLRDGGA